MKFQALGLPAPVCVALEKNQITEPTAVQNEAIPVVLEGRDLISSARTGSGKTLAYALPMITQLLSDPRRAALVLVPTREIASQVQQVMGPYLAALKLPSPTLIIGGVSFGPQIQNLRRNPRIIVATPGRLNDHLRQGKLRLDHMQTLVLDEADRMLDMGFLPQVKQILKFLPQQRQTLLFSATMPADLMRACKEMLKDPARVAVDAPNIANTDIEQRMQEVNLDGKTDALLDAINTATEAETVLVFARTKRRTDRVAQFLDQSGLRSERIHGDRSQAQRQKAIDSFRSGRVKVLVATDIAARGLDIPSVGLVINFDLPEAREDYVHRIGRTGRAGAQGIALSFVLPEERGHWGRLSGTKSEGGSSGARPAGRSFGRGGGGGKRNDRGGARFGGGRSERSERPQNSERPQFERPERTEQAPRFERSERSERPAFERPIGGGDRKPKFKKWGERREGGEAPQGGFGSSRARPENRSEGRSEGQRSRPWQSNGPRHGGGAKRFGAKPRAMAGSSRFE